MKEIIDNLDEIRMMLKQKALINGDTQSAMLAHLMLTEINKLREYEFETILKQNSDEN